MELLTAPAAKQFARVGNGAGIDVVVVVNPWTDEKFRRAVQAASREAMTCSGLELALMAHYPDVRIVEGVTEGPNARWYAYRDGRWVRPIRRRLPI